MRARPFRYGYNTNGFAHHRLDDALRVIAEVGYEGCAITLDHAHLDPFAPDVAAAVERIAALAGALHLSLVVETGARFLLDPRRKHEPTLLSDEAEGRARRREFLERALAIARDLGAGVVSLWSGVRPPGAAREVCWKRLVEEMRAVARRAEATGVGLGFEPEPGMLVESVGDFLELRAAVDSPALGLTLDLGHCLLTEPDPPEKVVRRVAAMLVNVHAEDMRRPTHEHLALGLGEMRYGPILTALGEVAYGDLVGVELSRDSHRAPEVAKAALAYLQSAEREAP
jgi:sugar phosphate isomerase/epimerase